jgi:uncharacterized membrane protein YqaE (UPF0057 family)
MLNNKSLEERDKLHNKIQCNTDKNVDLGIIRKSDTYLTKAKKDHKTYCEEKGHPINSFSENGPCLGSEGCAWSNDTCTLDYGGDSESSLAATYMNGGFGFGKMCMSREFTRIILLFIFPPLYVYLNERENNFEHYGEIILSALYTSIFYIPGLIHALMYKHNRNR